MTRFETLRDRLADLTENRPSVFWQLFSAKTAPVADLVTLTPRSAAQATTDLRDAA